MKIFYYGIQMILIAANIQPAHLKSRVLTLEQFYTDVLTDGNGNCDFELKSEHTVRLTGSSCLKIPEKLNDNWMISSLQAYETQIKAIRENEFNQLKVLENLVIDKNPINLIEDRAFHGLTALKNLSLSYSKLSVLPPLVFEGLINLQYLRIKKSYIKSITSFTIAASPKVLPNLKILDVSSNTFERIEKDDFHPMSGSSLEELTMKTCGISFIDTALFTHISKLKILNLSGNWQLTNDTIVAIVKTLGKNVSLESLDLSKLMYSRIPTDVLKLIPNETSLSTLYLMKYETVYLNKDVFPYLPHLRVLVLDKNKMRKMNENAFDNVKNLRRLSMKNNFLPAVPAALSSLTLLEDLNMAGKGKFINYFSVDTYNFSKNPYLKILDLSKNKIDKVNENSFPGAKSLEHLTLIGCNISEITAGAFKDMPNLKYLTLTHNPLIYLDVSSGGVLPTLSKLQVLSISRSAVMESLENKDTKPFQFLKQLKRLEMSEISLKVIYNNLFEGLNDLEYLNLDKNLIHDWDGMIFSRMSKLKLLDLSANRLSGTTRAFTNDLEKLRNSTSVDLSYNPFSCGCNELLFINWLKSTKVRILGLHTYETRTKYQCESSKSSLVLQEILPCAESTLNVAIISVLVIILLISCVLLVFFIMVKYRPKSYISNAWFHLTIKYSSNSNSDKYTYDAFISYCSSDFKWINDQLLPTLEHEIDSMKLCIYERDFLPGKEISNCILESINKSRKIILVLTNNFIKSQWCTWEMHMAQCTLVENKRNDLLIILLEELDEENIAPMLKYLLTTRIYLAWSNESNKQQIFWTKLRSIINGATNPAQLPLTK